MELKIDAVTPPVADAVESITGIPAHLVASVTVNDYEYGGAYLQVGVKPGVLTDGQVGQLLGAVGSR